jgi:hypothetical protein
VTGQEPCGQFAKFCILPMVKVSSLLLPALEKRDSQDRLFYPRA